MWWPNFRRMAKTTLNWDQLRELVAEGMIVGCHSYTHTSLYELSAEDLQREVFDARDEIEAQLVGQA